MRPAAGLLAALALVLPGPAAAEGIHASADLLPGDRLHGNLPSGGDEDRLSIYLPGGSVVDAEALAEKESLLLPDLELLDPEGDPVNLAPYTTPGPGEIGEKVKGLPIPADGGGVHVFRVVAGGSSSGKYAFRSKVKAPKSFGVEAAIPAESFLELPFDAAAGSKMKYAVKPEKGTPDGTFVVDTLRDPDGDTVSLDGLKDSGIPLGKDGTWILVVDSAGETTATAAISVTLTLPKASKRELWLSAEGFGPAPKITALDPAKVLDDRIAEDVEATVTNLDPAASIRLEKSGADPIAATDPVLAEGGFVADFDVRGVPTGTWNLVVENPSGAVARRNLTVQAAGSVNLPAGLRPETEAWWIDFREGEFRDDLRDIGLGSNNESVEEVASAAVKDYAFYWLRLAFRLDPDNGKTVEGSVPVSFSRAQPPETVGLPGSGYDRLVVGGEPALDDPSSNPYYSWGDGPLDAGNAAYDDVGPETEAHWGVRTAALAPTLSGSVSGYYLAVKPLRDVPLTGADLKYFAGGYVPLSSSEAARYRDIVFAFQAVGRELAGTLAHFIARAHGVADGATGLAKVPTQTGEYATLGTFAFTTAEYAAMTASILAGLPGKGPVLEVGQFLPRETVGYLLPDATTAEAYDQDFLVAGGRPDRTEGDVVFQGVSGSIPPGFVLEATGGISGTAPLRYADNTLVGGVYKFVVRWKDKETGQQLLFSHRLNLLVDTSHPSLSAAEVSLGTQKNAQTLTTP
jgi:hypothetical protein